MERERVQQTNSMEGGRQALINITYSEWKFTSLKLVVRDSHAFQKGFRYRIGSIIGVYIFFLIIYSSEKMPLPSFPIFSGLPDLPSPRRLLLDFCTLLDHQIGGGKHILFTLYFCICCLSMLLFSLIAHEHFIYIWCFEIAWFWIWSMNFWSKKECSNNI